MLPDPTIYAESLTDFECVQQFVRACEECQRFLNIHHKQVAGFLPPSATPYLPKRYPHIYNYQLAEGFRYHYCSAECLGNGYTHFHQLIDAHARTNMWPDLVVQKERIESDWSVILPTVPPDMIIRAICLEIEATNPKLNPFHSRSSSLDHGDNKRHKASDTKHTKSGGREERSKLDKSSSSRASREAALSKRTPKQRLKILEQFKPSKKSLEELIPLSELLAEYVSLLLLDYAPFNIEPPLIMDIARRIYNNHHTIVLGVHDDKNLAKYMENFPRIVREGTTEQKEKKMLEDSDKELRASGAGGLPLLWHPVASALYSAQGLINHSCSPNVYYSTIHHDVHNIDVIAARSIATGEEITASYLDPSLLTLPVQSRRAHLSSNFGFQCECLACKIQSSPKS